MLCNIISQKFEDKMSIFGDIKSISINLNKISSHNPISSNTCGEIYYLQIVTYHSMWKYIKKIIYSNRIRNEEIYLTIWVTFIDEKINKSYLR